MIARDTTWTCGLGRVPEWDNSFVATSLLDLISYVKGKKFERGSYGEILEGTLGTRPVAIKRLHPILNQETVEGHIRDLQKRMRIVGESQKSSRCGILGCFQRSFRDRIDVPNVAEVP